MAEGNSVYHWLRIIILAILTSALVWLVLSKSLVAWLVRENPETVLATRPDNTQAMLWLANKKMKASLGNQTAKPTQPDQLSPDLQATDREIKLLAQRVLRTEPLSPRALRILGQLADKAGDKKQAEQLMKAATRLSIRESAAVVWLIYQNYKDNNYNKALHYSDMLLRTRRKLDKYVFPVMMQIAQSPKGKQDVAKLLAQNPPWRLRFFHSLNKAGITDLRMPLRLLVTLKTSPTPPTQKEIRSYLNFLTRKKQYNLAYYSWLQFLPARQLETAGFLFNGSFEYELDGFAFNWRLPRTPKATVEIYQRPDQKGRALSIEFGYGHGRFGSISQMIMLTPGDYHLKGLSKGNFRGRRGLRWRIRCIDGRKRPLAGQGKMFLGMVRQWKKFEIAFTIPNKNCQAQQIKLILDARTASEKLVSGHVWYDDLAITRAPRAQ